MTRCARARRHLATTAAAFSFGLAASLTAPAALAEEPDVTTIEVSQGSSEAAESQGAAEGEVSLATTVLGLVNTTASALKGVELPEVTTEDGATTVVIDPATIPGLAEAFRLLGDHSGLSPQRGMDSAGNVVVFPTSGELTSGFGPRWGAFHNGIDVANPVGTPIYSVMDGEVISAGPAQGFGHWIRIRHVDGSVSVYGHMPGDRLMVNVGDHVRAGEQISVIGNEGHSTGPHLHFEIHPDGGAAVDPVEWFAQRGIII